MPITDPNDPNYDPSQDPNFMAQAGEPNQNLQSDRGVNQAPLPAEQRLVNPDDPDSVTEIRYNPDGTVYRPGQDGPDLEDLGPPGMPPGAQSDAPFSEDTIPTGWSRLPTAQEVAYLNKRYPVPQGIGPYPTSNPSDEYLTTDPDAADNKGSGGGTAGTPSGTHQTSQASGTNDGTDGAAAAKD